VCAQRSNINVGVQFVKFDIQNNGPMARAMRRIQWSLFRLLFHAVEVEAGAGSGLLFLRVRLWALLILGPNLA
jgi:hypothetical protein